MKNNQLKITAESVAKESNQFGETNDCAVRAVSVAGQISYRKVHRTFRELGRKRRKGTARWLWKLGCTMLNVKLVDVTEIYVKRYGGKTIRTLFRILPKTGRYIVVTNNHAFAVVNGERCDGLGLLGCHRVEEIFRIGD